MKLLLFDENLSPRLVDHLADIYPGSVHVSTVGLGSAFDKAVWEYARQNDFMIVTRDADFSEMSVVSGFPPKIIWIRRGNCSTRDIETLLRSSYDAVTALSDDPENGILSLY
jgi:predicted nuclease of predicted toxin-antitoxin system